MRLALLYGILIALASGVLSITGLGGAARGESVGFLLLGLGLFTFAAGRRLVAGALAGAAFVVGALTFVPSLG